MHYRDDQAALEARRDDLRQELADLTKKAAELRAAEQSRAAVERELAAIEAKLAHREARRASLLEAVRVASPCNASWDAMKGDDRVRFCGECQKNVYNLSAMTREEAEALLQAREGSLCVRLYRRADGTVLTADCPEGVRKKRVRLAVFSAAGAGALAAAATTFHARAHATCGIGSHPVRPQAALGKMAPIPETYVEIPLDQSLEAELDAEPGVVLVLRRELPRGGDGGDVWRVYEDGRVFYEAAAMHVRTFLPPERVDRRAVDAIVAKTKEIRRSAIGVVRRYERIVVEGTGTRDPSDQERREIALLAARLMVQPPIPKP